MIYGECEILWCPCSALSCAPPPPQGITYFPKAVTQPWPLEAGCSCCPQMLLRYSWEAGPGQKPKGPTWAWGPLGEVSKIPSETCTASIGTQLQHFCGAEG
jgi:hypothetical protein